ncbi:MAG: flippase-like domain-containing protein [Rhodospirillales bacterium]|jgi:putative membrane protein|nr:flippase-like domain-containing protein [Rhodospirillales bacterium]
MKRPLLLMLTLGVVLFVVIVVAHGIDDVAAALAAAGVFGIGMVVIAHAAPLAFDIAAWLAVLPRPHRRPLRQIAPMRWYAEAINTLLPVAQVGGEFVRAQLLARRGVPGPMAGASVVVDMAATIVSLIAFTLIGVGLLLARSGAEDSALRLALGIAVFATICGILYLCHRSGLLLRLGRELERRVAASGRGGATLTQMVLLDRCVRRLFRRRGPFAACLILHLLAWISGAGEVWLAMAALGQPVTVVDALIIESLGMAIRTAAFPIPGALGVQEGGLIVLGGLLGIDPAVALALALIKRVRELAWGVPGVVLWQAGEGRRLLARRPPAAR